MYQVQLNHLKSRIRLLHDNIDSNGPAANRGDGLRVQELCSICEKLLSFIEELSTKRS